MTRNLLLLTCLIAPGTVGVASAQTKPAKPESKTEAAILRIQNLLAEPMPLYSEAKEMSLVQFLAGLETRVPGGKKIKFRIDNVFGEHQAKVAAARIKLPRMKNVSMDTILRKALSRVGKVMEVDYTLRPDGVLITQPRLAVYRMTYDIRYVAQHLPLLLPRLKEEAGDIFQGVSPTDGPALLTRLIANTVALRSWETMQVLNGRLVVVAASSQHWESAGQIEVLRRLLDEFVVMNARLYEVDQAFFTTHVAPLFVADSESGERPVIISLGGPLLKLLNRQSLLQESEDLKLRANQDATFLSRQSGFRFVAGPHPTKPGQKLIGTGLAGVSLDVRPVISYDRRSLRLRITQKISQLIGIEKSPALDLFSGKGMEVESPVVRRTSVTGTVQILDQNPILMPIHYPPPGKGGEQKVWLLVARPFIWIEDEVEFLRQQGKVFSPKSVWESKIQEVEKPPR